MTTRLVDTADIAEMLGVCRAHVTNRIVKRPDFPAPVINLSQKLKKWSAEEVARYVKGGRRSEQASRGSTHPAAGSNPGAR